MSKKIKLEDYTPDDKNFNKHTQRGMGLLERSVEQVGVIESVTVSADHKVISGNARHEVMTNKFEGTEPIVVETDGTRPVILKRTDIVSGTKEFHTAALLANTVSKLNLDLDLEKIQEVAVEEFDMKIEELGIDVEVVLNPGDDQGKIPDGGKQFFINIRCDGEEHAQELYERFVEEGLDIKIVT